MAGKSKRLTNDNDNGGEPEMVQIRAAEAEEAVEESAMSSVLCSFPGGLPLELQQQLSQQGAVNGKRKSHQTEGLKFQWQPASKKSKRKLLVGQDQVCRYTAVDENQNIDEPQQPRPTTPPLTKAKPNNKKQAQLRQKQQSALSASTAASKTSTATSPATRLCVGIYDKQTKTITLHEVYGGGRVLSMMQSVPTYEGANDEEEKDFWAKRRSLYEDFASAKKKKSLKSKDANRVDVETVVGSGRTLVDSFLKGESMSQSNKRAIQEHAEAAAAGGDAAAKGKEESTSAGVDAATEQWRKSFLPPFDAKAPKPDKVYKAADLVGGEHLYRAFSRIPQRTVNDGDDIRKRFMSDYQSKNVPVDKNSNDKDSPQRSGTEGFPSLAAILERIVKRSKSAGCEELIVKQLTLLTALRQFVILHRLASRQRNMPTVHGDGGSRSHYFGTHVGFARYWLKTFTTETFQHQHTRMVHVMGKANRDKSHAHMLLLYLMAFGFESMTCPDIRPFVNELKLDVVEASNLLRETGCHVTKEAQTGAVAVTLVTPLKFPEQKRPGRGKSRN